jgi:DNA-binding GntR family transcriptional regulator
MAKGTLLALLGKPPGKFSGRDKDEDDGEDEDGDESYEAAQDILDAIKDRDAHALHLALSRHYEECAEE